eukprot:6196886-Pleurochrysis_carterae.AAC.3
MINSYSLRCRTARTERTSASPGLSQHQEALRARVVIACRSARSHPTKRIDIAVATSAIRSGAAISCGTMNWLVGGELRRA